MDKLFIEILDRATTSTIDIEAQERGLFWVQLPVVTAFMSVSQTTNV